MTSKSCPHLVSLAQCGLELQAPQMLTTTKRRLRAEAPENGPDPIGSLRYMAWDPVSVRAVFTDLDPASMYELEATYLTEDGVTRTQSLSAGTHELHPPVALPPGEPLVIRSAVPPGAIVNGSLEVHADLVDGPDAVVSELRLYSSVPARLRITVVGDSRGGLIGSVSDAGYQGIAGAEVVVNWPGGILTTTTDKHGLFRIALTAAIPPGRQAALDIVATSGEATGRSSVDTSELSLGLRAQPAEADRIDLAGPWSFAPGRVVAQGGAPDRSTRVPGHILFDGHVPEDGIATMWRPFNLPESWADDAVFLRFDGAYASAEVSVNGSLVGTHGSGVTSFDIDISGFVRPGGNVVSVTLAEYSPHSVIDYMSWYAHVSLLGIWRPVYLFRTERLHLGDFDLSTDWDPDTAAGSIDVGMDVINLDSVGRDYQLALEVRDLDGRTILRMDRTGSVDAFGSARQSMSATVPGVEPWSAEVPRLYILRVELDTAQVYERSVGFRRVEVRGNELRVNGSPIRVLGVNRHDARMTSGRSLTTQQLRDDVLRFRHANVNTIRTSHYPADPRLLDICDELGMYVFQAAPVCWLNTGQWNLANVSPHLVPYLLEVTGETVARDKGHCCVIAWDLANESTWSWAFDAQLELVREIDPGRPTMFSFDLNDGVGENPLDQVADDVRPELRSYHYPGWQGDWERDLAGLATCDQPVICDEYIPIFEACQRYPHEAFVLPIDPGVRDYWVTAISPFMRRLFTTRSCIGGMVWSGVDDLFAIPHDLDIGEGAWAHLPKHDFLQQRDLFTDDNTTFFRGDGEWGVLDSWGRPRAEHWHLAKMHSPIEISDAEFDPDGATLTCVVRNGFSHRSLADLSVVLVSDGTETTVAMSAPPGETERLRIDLPRAVDQVDLEFRHPEGWIVDGYAWTAPDVLARLAKAVIARSTPGRWHAELPGFHVQSADRPDVPLDLPVADPSRADSASYTMTVPLVGHSWSGVLSVSTANGCTEFGYVCEYLGNEPINAREVGLAFPVPDALTELWWRREGDWSYYPPRHIGRPAGSAPSAARPRDLLRPEPLWEDDGNEMGSNDFRSAKRNVHIAGLTDGENSFSVLSTGKQTARACLHSGKPILHVLDWYGGVRTRDPVHPVWSRYFGGGLRIERGAVLRGTVSIVVGTLPEDVRR
jgi:beta-galactosidase